MDYPAAAEGGGEARGGGRGESGKINEVQARSTLESIAPKARSRSREVATLDEAPRSSQRVSLKIPSLASSSLSLVMRSTLACPSTTVTFACTLASSFTPSSQRRDDELRDLKRRCDTMLDFASTGSYHGPTTDIK